MKQKNIKDTKNQRSVSLPLFPARDLVFFALTEFYLAPLREFLICRHVGIVGIGQFFKSFMDGGKVDVASRYEILREAVSGTMSNFNMARIARPARSSA